MTSFQGSARLLSSTLTPFLYPCLDNSWSGSLRSFRNAARFSRPHARPSLSRRHQSTLKEQQPIEESDDLSTGRPPVDITKYDHLNPTPPDYSDTPFTDSCAVTIHAGAGGHGCISFLKEKYIANGPANGGDGGTGGSIYIQAVRGETSLHKLARRRIIKAERGRNGQGVTKGGKRGEDVVIIVPVGTVVREIERFDPLEEEDTEQRREKGFGRDAREDADARKAARENEEDGEQDEYDDAPDQSRKWRRDKWLLYPGTLPKAFSSADFPALPRPRRTNLNMAQPEAPLRLDLDKPMEMPMLLAAGAAGGLGNPHFVTKSLPRPKFATKGEDGMRISLQLELKLLADVGLVGLPNAGKSTLIRALTSSRARVGDWAFTTLAPNIGTVVLDNQRGRPSQVRLPTYENGEIRTHFTIADIPGLIEGAHMDRGLGLGFLRHIERAGVLAFVIDLSAGDVVEALKGLWKEVGEFERFRVQESQAENERFVPDDEGMVKYKPFASSISPGFDPEPNEDGSPAIVDAEPVRALPQLLLPPISSKPWLVVATKADLPGTQENFSALQKYLERVQAGEEEHPSGKPNAWRKQLEAVPVCAKQKEGVDGVRDIMVSLMGT